MALIFQYRAEKECDKIQTQDLPLMSLMSYLCTTLYFSSSRISVALGQSAQTYQNILVFFHQKLFCQNYKTFPKQKMVY